MPPIYVHSVQPGLQPLPNIKNIIAVASGKGGVGKSTVAVNLALGLQQQGASVGILDADIYGPSIPLMMGLDAQPESADQKTIEPLLAHGLQLASMGFLIKPTEAMIWRGPMVTQALQQLLTQTRWRALDYLVVDMPPGTGDISLTLAQRIPTTGVVIVTTPQEVAVADARRGLQMFKKVNIDVLGLVENMAYHICSHCGTKEAIFGSGGGSALAAESGVPLLGSVPLENLVRADMDTGKPTLVAHPQSDSAKAFQAIADQVAAAIANKKRNYSSNLPPVVKA